MAAWIRLLKDPWEIKVKGAKRSILTGRGHRGQHSEEMQHTQCCRAGTFASKCVKIASFNATTSTHSCYFNKWPRKIQGQMTETDKNNDADFSQFD